MEWRQQLLNSSQNVSSTQPWYQHENTQMGLREVQLSLNVQKVRSDYSGKSRCCWLKINKLGINLNIFSILHHRPSTSWRSRPTARFLQIEWRWINVGIKFVIHSWCGCNWNLEANAGIGNKSQGSRGISLSALYIEEEGKTTPYHVLKWRQKTQNLLYLEKVKTKLS